MTGLVEDQLLDKLEERIVKSMEPLLNNVKNEIKAEITPLQKKVAQLEIDVDMLSRGQTASGLLYINQEVYSR